MSISLCRYDVSAFQWNVSIRTAISGQSPLDHFNEIPLLTSYTHKLEKVLQCLFKPIWGIISVASKNINNTGHFLIHNIGQRCIMSIIEEHNISGEHNAEFTSNMQAPSSGPSAKKVYSKPTLVVLRRSNTAGKPFSTTEHTNHGGTPTTGAPVNFPSENTPHSRRKNHHPPVTT